MNFKFCLANLLALALTIPLAHANVPKWQTSATTKTAINITPSTAGLVFYRSNEQNSQANIGANITIDGQYLTSLHSGHFASSQVCAGTHRITATPTESYANNLNSSLSSLINVPARTIRYIKVSVNNQGVTTFEILDDQTAKNALIGTPQQAHQLNRVIANNCHNYANPL